jgi:hypothetical protein
MADIDIASPGANEAALKAAIGNLTGLVKITSVVVTDPVDYIDFDLPATDAAFILMFSNVRFSISDTLCAVFSSDGGTTFANDLNNFDTYLSVSLIIKGNGGSAADQFAHRFVDSMAYFDLQACPPDTTLPLAGESVITPGATDSYPSVSSFSTLMAPTIYRANTGSSFWEGAAALPVLARQNLVRVLPYGDGNAVPISGNTIVSGSFSLLRIPA